MSDRRDIGQHMPAAKKIHHLQWASDDARAKLRSGFGHSGLASAANVARRARFQVRVSAGDTIDVSLPLSGEALCVEA